MKDESGRIWFSPFARLMGRHQFRRSRFHNRVGQFAPWPLLARHAPLSLWTAVWAKLGRPVVRPWLLIEAQQRIAGLLRPGATCLEYGSGLSTLWLAERCQALYSVESDPIWYERIERELSRRGHRHVVYRLHPQAADYATFPANETTQQFDFILVDGIERAETVRQSLARLKPGGWLFLDDTDRRPYDAGNAASERALLAYARQWGGDLTYLNDLVLHEFRVRQGALYHHTGEMMTHMQTKAAMLAPASLSPITTAYFQLHHSKQLYRQGWLQAGLEPGQCESVADHSHGVSLLCWLLLGLPEYQALDPLKVAALAALHDAGEVYAGDLTPAHQVAPAEKEQRERAAVERIFGGLAAGERYLALWEEYAAHRSPEAVFVGQVDKLEMALQAAVYHRQGVNVAEFIASARQVISDPPLKAILADVEGLVTPC